MQPTSCIDRAYTFASLSSYSLKDRLLIRSADLVFFILINLIGRTVRFEIEGWDNWEAASRDGKIPIYTFWHNRVFLATYFWRRRRIVVMTSRSFDGEYIARFIQRFGYGAARGSSTRGATGALVEMVRLMGAGCPTAFTIDERSCSRRRRAIRFCLSRLRRGSFGKQRRVGMVFRHRSHSRERACTSRRRFTFRQMQMKSN